MNELFIGLIAGVFGTAYFVYGKRQSRFVPMICGVLLCVYPYFIDGIAWLCVVGALLLVPPFLTNLWPVTRRSTHAPSPRAPA